MFRLSRFRTRDGCWGRVTVRMLVRSGRRVDSSLVRERRDCLVESVAFQDAMSLVRCVDSSLVRERRDYLVEAIAWFVLVPTVRLSGSEEMCPNVGLFVSS